MGLLYARNGGAGVARLLRRFRRRIAACLRARRLSSQFRHMSHALLAQNFLHPLDGVAVRVKERANAAQQLHVVRTVIAPSACPLDWADLRKAGLPEAQHVLRHVQLGGDFADGAERLRRFRGERPRRGAHASASGRGASPLMTAFSTWLGRNTSTRRGAIGTSSPVLGLRPIRWAFCRTAKVPKDESFTVSPRASAEQTSSSISSTICADSWRDRPTA